MGEVSKRIKNIEETLELNTRLRKIEEKLIKHDYVLSNMRFKSSLYKKGGATYGAFLGIVIVILFIALLVGYIWALQVGI